MKYFGINYQFSLTLLIIVDVVVLCDIGLVTHVTI